MMVETEELVDSPAVAIMLGLSSYRAVSTYRTRYPDFPTPVVARGNGRLLLWRRQDVQAWVRQREIADAGRGRHHRRSTRSVDA